MRTAIWRSVETHPEIKNHTSDQKNAEDGDNCPSEPRYNFHGALPSASDTDVCLICDVAEADISAGSGAPAEGSRGLSPVGLTGD